jgi:cyclopropane fatty-acyl-phospholipid synthase-like methyltransferase
MSQQSATSHQDARRLLSQLLEAEKAITCGHTSQNTYLDAHQMRFADILRLCRAEAPNPAARVLDIGRSELTSYLAKFYKDIHTLGLDLSTDDGGHRETSSMDAVPHITFNLLDAHDVSTWPNCDRFDLIVFSEVIEHLSVAPEYVFAALGSLLSDNGVLICTTPNASDISKRIRLALGRNPYERLRLYANNPGHIREYTRNELRDIAQSVGLNCKSHSYFNWGHGRGNPIKTAVMKLLRAYPSFASFQICIFKKDAPPKITA